MKKIEKWRTFDGQEFESEYDARIHEIHENAMIKVRTMIEEDKELSSIVQEMKDLHIVPDIDGAIARFVIKVHDQVYDLMKIKEVVNS